MKKVLVLVVMLLMLVSLVACGEKEVEVADNSTVDEAVVEDPDTYENAVLYTDISKLLGAIPKVDGSMTIGFAAKAFENEFWGAVKDGVEAQGDEFSKSGVEINLDVRAAQGESDEQGQAALMNDMINKKYKAIIASPISDGNLVQATEKAQAEGIPVVNTIGGFAQVMDVFVGPRHYSSGELAAEYISNRLGKDDGEVAVIMGMPKESAARARTQGFKDWFISNNPKITVVDSQNADWDRGKAKDVMDTLIKKYPNLKAIYANNDTMVMGALEAVIAAGKKGQIVVVGNDGTSEALQSIRDGELDATVNIYPFFAGKISVDIALRALGGQDLPKVIYTNQALIDSTNVNEPAEDVIGWSPLVFE